MVETAKFRAPRFRTANRPHPQEKIPNFFLLCHCHESWGALVFTFNRNCHLIRVVLAVVAVPDTPFSNNKWKKNGRIILNLQLDNTFSSRQDRLPFRQVMQLSRIQTALPLKRPRQYFIALQLSQDWYFIIFVALSEPNAFNTRTY